MYTCYKVTFFLPRGFNQSMGTLHRERVSVVWSWYPNRILKQHLLEEVLIFRGFAGSLVYTHNYCSLFYYLL